MAAARADIARADRAVPAPGEDPVSRRILRQGLVGEDAYQAARMEARVTGETIGQILVRDSFISYRDLIQIVAEVAPDSMASVAGHVPDVKIPSETLERLSAAVIAEAHGMPGKPPILYVATLRSRNVAKRAFRLWYPDHDLRFCKVSPERIEEAIELVASREDEEGLREGDEEEGAEAMALDRLVYEALESGASDVHIMPREYSYTVLYRELGVRRVVHAGTRTEYNRVTARLKDRAGCDPAETRLPQDGSFTIEHRGKPVDFRVATIPVMHGEQIVVRVLDPEQVSVDIDRLGITRLDAWRRGTSRADGLCLICGPTGSGKTTTLNATVRKLDRFGKSIWTVEDPVEYRVPYIGQVSVNRALDFSFPQAIRAFMRADPDVIVVGEVRDWETADNCLQAAETGHLVFATLHAGSIVGALTRLRELGVQPSEFKHLLSTVLVQRLVRTFCGTCSGRGCEDCNGGGYGGRTIVSECMDLSSPDDVDRILAGEVWWTPLVDDAIDKMEAGETDREEIERQFGNEVEQALRKRGHEAGS